MAERSIFAAFDSVAGRDAARTRTALNEDVDHAVGGMFAAERRDSAPVLAEARTRCAGIV